jgi:hypothetical protein
MSAVTVTRTATSSSAHRFAPIPLTRVIAVELRKMFDTRSGFWLLASIAITSMIATVAVVLFAPDAQLTYVTFATAIGFPIAVILPIIAILSVTSEWSQRSGLTTFTLNPHRDRVIVAKAVCAIGIGIVSMLLAMVIGAIGNLVGSAVTGAPLTWDSSPGDLSLLVLGNVLGLLVGFMLGVLIRNSAGAVVAYLVYSFMLPTLAELLSQTTSWFADVRPWVDFAYAQTPLFTGDDVTGRQWTELGVTTVVWLVIPLAVGLRLVARDEVK